jgi:simple sugar transport system ATP-binding protein
MKAQEIIKMVDISKTFGSVVANENVNLTLMQGEIHALLGENGAGKSTLMNMLSGIYTPDGGSIFIRGKAVRFRSPMESIEQGIGMIHQHFKLVNVFTALENIVAGKKGKAFVNKKDLGSRIRKLLDEIGLEMDINKSIHDMSVSEKQTVEIIKVLYRGGEILILDEPTAVLTPQETVKLFDLLRKMKERGCAVVIITHKLNEVMAISDKVTVLRKGNTVATVKTAETTPKELTDLMVGKSVELKIERTMGQEKGPIMKVKDITVKNIEKVKVLKQVSFDLFSGEILGVAGIAGSGQKELCESLSGLIKVEDGEILYKDQTITGMSPREQLKKNVRIGFVPEDRLGMGLIPSMDIVNNLVLKEYQKEKGFVLKRKPVAKKAKDLVDQLEIKCPGIQNHAIKVLSGGNIQKVLIGREIDTQPEVLITAYPVRGLDIGASHTIYDLLNEQKANGTGILFVGEDLDILLALCDRIMVLCEGEVMGIVKANEVTKEQLGWMMAGKTLEEAIDNV